MHSCNENAFLLFLKILFLILFLLN